MSASKPPRRPGGTRADGKGEEMLFFYQGAAHRIGRVKGQKRVRSAGLSRHSKLVNATEKHAPVKVGERVMYAPNPPTATPNNKGAQKEQWPASRVGVGMEGWGDDNMANTVIPKYQKKMQVKASFDELMRCSLGRAHDFRLLQDVKSGSEVVDSRTLGQLLLECKFREEWRCGREVELLKQLKRSNLDAIADLGAVQFADDVLALNEIEEEKRMNTLHLSQSVAPGLVRMSPHKSAGPLTDVKQMLGKGLDADTWKNQLASMRQKAMAQLEGTKGKVETMNKPVQVLTKQLMDAAAEFQRVLKELEDPEFLKKVQYMAGAPAERGRPPTADAFVNTRKKPKKASESAVVAKKEQEVLQTGAAVTGGMQAIIDREEYFGGELDGKHHTETRARLKTTFVEVTEKVIESTKKIQAIVRARQARKRLWEALEERKIQKRFHEMKVGELMRRVQERKFAEFRKHIRRFLEIKRKERAERDKALAYERFRNTCASIIQRTWRNYFNRAGFHKLIVEAVKRRTLEQKVKDWLRFRIRMYRSAKLYAEHNNRVFFEDLMTVAQNKEKSEDAQVEYMKILKKMRDNPLEILLTERKRAQFEAAVDIQKTWRMYKAKQYTKKIRDAIIMIQRAMRNLMSKKKKFFSSMMARIQATRMDRLRWQNAMDSFREDFKQEESKFINSYFLIKQAERIDTEIMAEKKRIEGSYKMWNENMTRYLLKKPLKDDWIPQVDPFSGQKEYMNLRTGETQNEHPHWKFIRINRKRQHPKMKQQLIERVQPLYTYKDRLEEASSQHFSGNIVSYRPDERRDGWISDMWNTRRKLNEQRAAERKRVQEEMEARMEEIRAERHKRKKALRSNSDMVRTQMRKEVYKAGKDIFSSLSSADKFKRQRILSDFYRSVSNVDVHGAVEVLKNIKQEDIKLDLSDDETASNLDEKPHILEAMKSEGINYSRRNSKILDEVDLSSLRSVSKGLATPLGSSGSPNDVERIRGPNDAPETTRGGGGSDAAEPARSLRPETPRIPGLSLEQEQRAKRAFSSYDVERNRQVSIVHFANLLGDLGLSEDDARDLHVGAYVEYQDFLEWYGALMRKQKQTPAEIAAEVLLNRIPDTLKVKEAPKVTQEPPPAMTAAADVMMGQIPQSLKADQGAPVQANRNSNLDEARQRELKAKRAFAKYDRERSRTIPTQDLDAVLQELDVSKDFDTMALRSADVVNLDEFLAWYRRVLDGTAEKVAMVTAANTMLGNMAQLKMKPPTKFGHQEELNAKRAFARYDIERSRAIDVKHLPDLVGDLGCEEFSTSDLIRADGVVELDDFLAWYEGVADGSVKEAVSKQAELSLLGSINTLPKAPPLSEPLPKDVELKAKRAFAFYDRDRSRSIPSSDLSTLVQDLRMDHHDFSALESSGGIVMLNDFLLWYVNAFNHDKDQVPKSGGFSRDEEIAVKQAFAKYDKNMSRTISVVQLKSLVVDLGVEGYDRSSLLSGRSVDLDDFLEWYRLVKEDQIPLDEGDSPSEPEGSDESYEADEFEDDDD